MKDKIEKYYKANSIEKGSNIYFNEQKTQLHSFKYFHIIMNNYVIDVTVRDFQDKSTIVAFCKKIDALNLEWIPQIVKLEKMLFDNLHFDSLLLLPSEYHIMGYEEEEEKEILQRTVLAIPIYHCEFSGNENIEDVKNLRRDYINTIDWNRTITPKLKIKYKNYTTKSATIGKNNKLSDTKTLMNEIDALRDDLSFVEFENYKGIYFKVKWDKNKISIIQNQDLIFVGDVNLAKDEIWKYLIG